VNDDIAWSRFKSHRPMREVLVKRHACAVCNLRTDVLICRECAEDSGSLARVEMWLSKLGDDAASQVERARLERAKMLLETL